MHTFPESLVYDQKLQDTDLAYLFSSEKVPRSLAENTAPITKPLSGQLPCAGISICYGKFKQN